MKMGEEHEEGFLGEGGENGTLSVYGCPCMCAPFYARWRVCMRCLEGSWRIWTLELSAWLSVKVSERICLGLCIFNLNVGWL